jgi:hypothetical protein
MGAFHQLAITPPSLPDASESRQNRKHKLSENEQLAIKLLIRLNSKGEWPQLIQGQDSPLVQEVRQFDLDDIARLAPTNQPRA